MLRRVIWIWQNPGDASAPLGWGYAETGRDGFCDFSLGGPLVDGETYSQLEARLSAADDFSEWALSRDMGIIPEGWRLPSPAEGEAVREALAEFFETGEF